MLDLASAYSVFANNGTKIPFNPIISVRSPTESDLVGHPTRSDPQGVEVLPPAIAYQINSILSDVSARAPAFGVNSILNLPGKNIAVKTGTTNNLRGPLATPRIFLIATWVGNNDILHVDVASGITGTSPIWARTMKTLLKR
jgi:membrane peptidoglycan carboxypeptidase